MSALGWVIFGFMCATMALAVSVIAVDEKTYIKRMGGRRRDDA